MPTFAELKETVIDLTKRPDLDSVIGFKILDVVKRLHLMQVWPRDFTALLVTLPSPVNEYVIPYASVPRFRGLSYIRFWDPIAVNPMTNVGTGWFGESFSEIRPDDIFDGYNTLRNNIFYLTGGGIFLRSLTKFSSVVVGYYQHPITSPTTALASWIVDDYELAVVSGVCAEIFASVGDNDQAKNYGAIHNAHVMLLQTNNNEATLR
jgi:hypothetical protein